MSETGNEERKATVKKKQKNTLAAGQFVSQSLLSALTLVFRTFEADLFEIGVGCQVKCVHLELSAETLNVQVEHRYLLVSGQATQLHRKLHTDTKRTESWSGTKQKKNYNKL